MGNDGKTIAAADANGATVIYDSANGQELYLLDPPLSSEPADADELSASERSAESARAANGPGSVSFSRDGTLLATVLMHPGQTFVDVFAGKPTGAVYRWSPGDSGFVQIPGSELPGNNGIEISSDEREIFVVSSGLQTISVFANTSPTRLLRSTQALDFGPDNVHMTPDGQLITAGPSMDDHACGELDVAGFDLEEFASCPKGSVAATFDPETLVETRRWSSPADPRFSNATMALQVGDEVWIGSFSGDRIGVVAKAR